MRRLRDEASGFTLIELMVVAFIGSLLLAMAGTYVMSASRTGAFAESQSATLNDMRTAVEQMSREIRGADAIEWCTPAGSCLEVGAQTATGTFITVRYTHVADVLERAVFDDATSTWGDPQKVIDRVVNGAGDPVFACEANSSLLRVNIDLSIEPTPDSDPVLNIVTSVRPRNYPSKATCPSP